MATKTRPRQSKLAFGSLSASLRFYRIMAFITGTVLLLGTIGLVVQQFVSLPASILGPVWLGHGYLFVVYVLATANLGLHLRWHPIRMILTAAAGTVPTMSFVAERIVVHKLNSDE